MAKHKIGTTKDYNQMYNDLKMQLVSAPRDIKVQVLQKFYRKIVDTANHRLLEIERFSERPEYEEVKKFAYKLAMYDITGAYGEDAKRFKASDFKVDDLKHSKKNINMVLRFLEMPTSTKVGVYNIYQKRADKINKEYGTNVNWETIANLFQSKLYTKLNEKLNASKTAVKVIGVLQANKKELKQYFKELDQAKKNGQKHPDVISIQVSDKELSKRVNDALKEYGTDIKKLIKKI